MADDTLPNVNVEFLVRLRKIDKRSLTARDVLVLYIVIQQPGLSGIEVTNKIGLPDRSAIASCLLRLEREGYIEDRREVRSKANPAILHPTQKGIDFWDEIKPS